jgi:hypothetical protein
VAGWVHDGIDKCYWQTMFEYCHSAFAWVQSAGPMHAGSKSAPSQGSLKHSNSMQHAPDAARSSRAEAVYSSAHLLLKKWPWKDPILSPRLQPCMPPRCLFGAFDWVQSTGPMHAAESHTITRQLQNPPKHAARARRTTIVTGSSSAHLLLKK